MDEFTSAHNQFAPFCYKAIIFSLIENHQDTFVRDYIISNLIITLRNHEDVPVHVVVEPLVKQHAAHGYSNVDFDFFLVLAKHPKLPVKHAMLLLHLLGKIALNDIVFGRLACIPFLVLANRFSEEGNDSFFYFG
jgi:hypothetical protein